MIPSLLRRKRVEQRRAFHVIEGREVELAQKLVDRHPPRHTVLLEGRCRAPPVDPISRQLEGEVTGKYIWGHLGLPSHGRDDPLETFDRSMCQVLALGEDVASSSLEEDVSREIVCLLFLGIVAPLTNVPHLDPVSDLLALGVSDMACLVKQVIYPAGHRVTRLLHDDY